MKLVLEENCCFSLTRFFITVCFTVTTVLLEKKNTGI